MVYYILRRLLQTVLTVLGVMFITFLLFRGMQRDVASIIIGQKATAQQKARWRHANGYDLPLVANFIYRYIEIIDKTNGPATFSAADGPGSMATEALGLFLEPRSNAADKVSAGTSATGPADSSQEHRLQLLGRYVWFLSEQTPIEELTAGQSMIDMHYRQAEPAGQHESGTTQPEAATQTAPSSQPPPQPAPVITFSLANGDSVRVDLSGVETCGQLLARINRDPSRLEARISEYHPLDFFNSQFFRHLYTSITFQSKSFKDDKSLTAIIADHGPYSLAIQLPALALEWLIGLVIACYVAYYRGSTADKIGVFVSVLGMCIPYLAILILGQWFMFQVASGHYATFSLIYPASIYVPVLLMVLAAIGGNVRFYRTIILDETGRDYVRTARAKGVPLPSILFKHVLKNCMLPILTSLISTIPFLILGGLLVERIFGIPGLGDLMITSINNGDEPIMNGLVFLTSLVFCLAVLATDVCYAIFDPRIRLK